ncbi:MAG: hypothetical protein ACOYK8_01020 [Alphaproteobacteria bacterium]
MYFGNENDWKIPNPLADSSAAHNVVYPRIDEQKQCQQFRNSPAGRKLNQ